MSNTILRCRIHVFDGVTYYYPFAEESEKVAKLITTNLPVFRTYLSTSSETEDLLMGPKDEGEESVNYLDGVVREDLRLDPPYYNIVPCPYCGVKEDRGHDPMKHINPALGEKVG